MKIMSLLAGMGYSTKVEAASECELGEGICNKSNAQEAQPPSFRIKKFGPSAIIGMTIGTSGRGRRRAASPG